MAVEEPQKVEAAPECPRVSIDQEDTRVAVEKEDEKVMVPVEPQHVHEETPTDDSKALTVESNLIPNC